MRIDEEILLIIGKYYHPEDKLFSSRDVENIDSELRDLFERSGISVDCGRGANLSKQNNDHTLCTNPFHYFGKQVFWRGVFSTQFKKKRLDSYTCLHLPSNSPQYAALIADARDEIKEAIEDFKNQHTKNGFFPV